MRIRQPQALVKPRRQPQALGGDTGAGGDTGDGGDTVDNGAEAKKAAPNKTWLFPNLTMKPGWVTQDDCKMDQH